MLEWKQSWRTRLENEIGQGKKLSEKRGRKVDKRDRKHLEERRGMGSEKKNIWLYFNLISNGFCRRNWRIC